MMLLFRSMMILAGLAGAVSAAEALNRSPPVAAPLMHLANYEAYNRCMRDAGDRHRSCIRGCDSHRSRMAWNQCSNSCARILDGCSGMRPAPSPPARVTPR